jgi:hypothetical protein
LRSPQPQSSACQPVSTADVGARAHARVRSPRIRRQPRTGIAWAPETHP